MRTLVTGATGYVGGRLVPALLEAGHDVTVMARSERKVHGHAWADRVDVAVADATRPEQVAAALEGVDVAYYLLHSIGTGPDFAATERRIAEDFAAAAERAGVRRIVYLGGMDPRDEELSEHLRSRSEVAQVLLDSAVPTAVLQAGVVIGSGSASFEMLRYLTERLPVMVVPRWVHSKIQPIAVRDVLRYLVGCAELPADVNRRFDIGGPDVLSYLQMMRLYAEVAGLPRRRVLPVPVLSPTLSSHWVGLITPVPSGLARPLVESLRNTSVAREHDIAAYVPDPPEGLIGYRRAVELALTKIRDVDVPTRWSSASPTGAPSEPLPSDPDWAGGSLYVDEREREVHADPAALWRVIEGIGGENGWYSFPLGWQVRGLIDRLSGGPGLRRGRRDPRDVVVGDSVDFWRVEEVEEGRLLRLRAEMRLPGLAWLELSVGSAEHGTTTFHQRALFHPHGAAGHLYWWSVWPFHGIVFGSMQRNIARAAERR
ncbi:MAG TPA: SDR family oxidoreductase [Nocardioidaceae bacterium]|nr:SDR family oxidoreductase [Nocardioidaceae bacterium]